jgi:hypothetical protein
VSAQYSGSKISRETNQHGAWPPGVCWFLAQLIFDCEDEGDTLFRNVGSYTDYTVLYPRIGNNQITMVQPTFIGFALFSPGRKEMMVSLNNKYAKFKPLMLDLIRTEVDVYLRPKVSRSVCLGVRHPSVTRDQFFFHLGISFRRLQVW